MCLIWTHTAKLHFCSTLCIEPRQSRITAASPRTLAPVCLELPDQRLMPGAAGPAAECTRRVCSAALNALLRGEQLAHATWSDEAPAAALVPELQDAFASLGVQLRQEANGCHIHVHSASVETAAGLLRLHQANYESDTNLAHSVSALGMPAEQLSQLEPSDRRHVRALLAATEANGALAVFQLLQAEDWELLDDMRRRVYQGDLAFTDGWGAYLIVQAKMVPEEPGKAGHSMRAVKRKRCREVATKNLAGWAEHHPDAAIVLSASFTNLDGLELVEAPNSGIILAALQELAGERRLAPQVPGALGDASSKAHDQPPQQQQGQQQAQGQKKQGQRAGKAVCKSSQEHAPLAATQNTRGPGSSNGSSAGGDGGAKTFKEALEAHVSAKAPLVLQPAPTIEALAQSVAARAQRLQVLDSLVASVIDAVNHMRLETYQGMVHEHELLASLQQPHVTALPAAAPTPAAGGGTAPASMPSKAAADGPSSVGQVPVAVGVPVTSAEGRDLVQMLLGMLNVRTVAGANAAGGPGT